MEEPTNDQQLTKAKRKKWLKRIGIAGFLFFLIKGLVWIAVLLYAWKGCE